MGDARRAAAQGLHGRGEAAHELVIVVGIQNIVLAVVLGLRHQIDVLEALGEIAARALAFGAAAIGVAAPVEIDVGEIGAIVPAALVHHAPAGPRHRRRASSRTRDRPRAVAPPRHRIPSASSALRRARTLAAIGLASSGSSSTAMARDRAADNVHLGRKGVAEQSGDAKGDVDARTLQFAQAA